jgi:hypothetical protein
VVLDSNLRIVCVAVAMTNTHDFKLFKQSRLPIKKETLVCVDTGYLGLVKIKAFKIVATKYRNRRKRFGLRFKTIFKYLS